MHRVRSRQFDVSSAFGVNLYLNYFFESFFFFLSLSLKYILECYLPQVHSREFFFSTTFWKVICLKYILSSSLTHIHFGRSSAPDTFWSSLSQTVHCGQFIGSSTVLTVLCLRYILTSSLSQVHSGERGGEVFTLPHSMELVISSTSGAVHRLE